MKTSKIEGGAGGGNLCFGTVSKQVEWKRLFTVYKLDHGFQV